MSGASRSSATQKPWDIQIPYLEGGFKKAQELHDQGMPDYYGGKTLANFGSPEKAAHRGIMTTAEGPEVTGMGRDARGQLANTYGLGGKLMGYGGQASRYGISQKDYAGMTPFQNQQLSDMLAGKVNTSQLAPVVSAMGRDIMGELSAPGGMLSQIRGQQVGYQPGGSSRGDIMSAMAGQGAAQKLADQASRMYADAYAKAQDRRLPAGQMALGAQQTAQQLGLSGGQMGMQAMDRYPAMMNAMYDRFGKMQSVGQQQRAMAQEDINQKMAKYNYNQMKPYQGLQNYMSMISGQYGGQSTATPSPLSSMGQLASLFMGLKSDIRTKENIVPEATNWKGFNVYTFNYIGDGTPRRGVMAQEVERTRPDAVYEIGGIKHVAYGLL